MPEYTVFIEETFWSKFPQDLKNARCRVLIQSPFISARRIAYLSKTFTHLVNTGVTICTFVQEPWHWNEKQAALEPEIAHRLSELRSVVQLLTDLRVHVTFKKDIHEKLAVIDEDVLWDGSLNMLSHANTKERILRWTDPSVLRQAISQHSLEDCSVCVDNYMKFGLGTAKSSPVSLGVPVLTNRLMSYRVDCKLSQQELAKRCGLTQGRISHIETGNINVSLGTFLGITSELEVEPVLVPRISIPSVIRLLNAQKRLK